MLPHLAVLNDLVHSLGSRVVLNLQDGNKDTAWTNLMASTRLVTAWEVEPIEMSQLVRFKSTTLAFDTIWQALQADGWTDKQLASLQREWESVDFFKNLPDTAAYERASAVAMCQQERNGPQGPGTTYPRMLQSPGYLWYELTHFWSQIYYGKRGTYEDEKALLLHYRDRELELRRAVQSPTWSEMRNLPGVTNVAAFHSKYYSRMQDMMNVRQIMVGMHGLGLSLLSRTAEAEACRRLIITAIALERYRGRHGSYPKKLAELTPEQLKNPLLDFMDGKPLRYRLTEDGHFVLYSVGLDCVDNGGKMQRLGPRERPAQGLPLFGIPQGTDLVWPRPASLTEVETQEEQKEQAGPGEWGLCNEHEEAKRQAAVKRLLEMKPAHRLEDPTYQGQPLSKLLRNERAEGKTPLTLDEMLTLKQIITGDEPGAATFEVPLSFDAVTNIGELDLLIDDSHSFHGWMESQTCERATNGNCLLIWNTTIDPPGSMLFRLNLFALRRRPATLSMSKVQFRLSFPLTSVNSIFLYPSSIRGERLFTPSCPRRMGSIQ